VSFPQGGRSQREEGVSRPGAESEDGMPDDHGNYTDGELSIGVLVSVEARGQTPRQLENPIAVQIKEQFWSAIRPLLQSLPSQ